jgi:hypothetical protein
LNRRHARWRGRSKAEETRGLLQIKVQAALTRYLTQESLAIAFQDTFIVVTLIFAAAAIASLCIPAGMVRKP